MSEQTVSEETPTSIAEAELRSLYEQYLKLPLEELAKRLAYLEWRLKQCDPQIMSLINGIGEYFRAIRRDYIPVEGILLKVRLVPEEFEIWTESETRQWGSDVIIHEQKVIRLPAKSVVYYEVIPFRKIEELRRESPTYAPPSEG